MDEKILTLHPEGKKGVNINKKEYDIVSDSIAEIHSEYGEMTLKI